MKKSKNQNETIEVLNSVVYFFLVLRTLAQITEAAIKIKHLCSNLDNNYCKFIFNFSKIERLEEHKHFLE